MTPTQELEIQMQAAGLPLWDVEWRFHETRRWRLDYAWPWLKLAVEVHGGVHAGGRHTRGVGFTKDRAKMNTAQTLGWRVLEVTPEQIKSGEALAWIEDLVAKITKAKSEAQAPH